MKQTLPVFPFLVRRVRVQKIYIMDRGNDGQDIIVIRI